VLPPFSHLGDLVREGPRDDDGRWQDTLRETVSAVAGLTAVDGATIITDRYDLVAFGAKISRRRGSATVEQVVVTEPIEGGTADVVHPTRLGGTRHLSAAQFVHDQHNAVALVASQDGRFTVFAWSPCEETVHAHRVEALLL
jgi:DNA integrity scanning protein DisA with diadenylate cyclase activity